MKKILLSLVCLAAGITALQAQVVKTDSTQYTKVEDYDVTTDVHRVISNPWNYNWFVTGDAGVNAYWGDCPVGKFTDRLTPQFNLGVGHWILPSFGLSAQVAGFRSKGDKGIEGLYTRGSATYYDGDGNPYWKERIKWVDFSFNAMFNITHIIYGYKGIMNKHLLDQFIASVGIGATHHYGLPYGSANEWSSRIELQYSHFFKPSKALSLDVKLRTFLYETKYDGVYNHQKFDKNISLNVGVTYYFKPRGWSRKANHTTVYRQQYDDARIAQLNDEIQRLKSMPVDTVVIEKSIASALEDVKIFPYLVNFVVDKVEVVNRERVNLSWIAEMIKATPKQKYLISGYADKHTGTVERNKWLAIHRAENVYKVLTEEFGVPKEQLLLSDFGGVDNMFYDDKQVSRSAIITRYEGQPLNTFKGTEPDYKE